MELLCKALSCDMATVPVKDTLKQEPLLYRTEQLVSLNPPVVPAPVQPAPFTPALAPSTLPIHQYNELGIAESPKMVIDGTVSSRKLNIS